ncbi:8-oxoguanine deaminase [Azonexus sp. IMCC34842]|uniref:8-oxoguanine deaminase n=1 Tax=Azonexus sp. IMCC34842 TaxID=3420950 RepID=UPI003D0B0656
MTTLLLKDADVLVTMDAARREIVGGGVFIRDGVIEAVGSSAELPASADRVISLAGTVALPGLVNTHHHMYQSLTRVIPGAQDAELFGWLRRLYPIWAGLTPEMIRISTLTAMAELILSGCTTSSDHLYIYPNGSRLDDSIEAAATIGMRFHAARGSMSVGESQGGLPPDRLVESEASILKDTQRLIETWHDPARHAMQRIVVAPCSPFSVSRDLMRESAALARSHGVSLHTHLAENDNDVAYSREKFGMTPAEYAESLGWVGHDVWHAHCVKLDAPGIGLFARTGTGVAHCPCSNMRLASGIAPIPAMRAAGVHVGLGVDGCASNDAAHLLGEARQAMLLARVSHGQAAMNARQALELATLGGAKVLGRDDIGALAPGMSADLVAFSTGGLDLAGAAVHDPVAALVFCTPQAVRHSIINGKAVVADGQLLPLDLPVLVATHNRLARQLVNGNR